LYQEYFMQGVQEKKKRKYHVAGTSLLF